MSETKDSASAAQSRTSTTTGLTQRKISTASLLLLCYLDLCWSSLWTKIGTCIESVQLLALIIGTNWPHGSIVAGIGVPISISILPLWDRDSLLSVPYLPFQAFFWVLIVSILLTCALFAFNLMQISRQQSRHGMRILSFAINVFSGFGFQITLHALLANVVCNGEGRLASFPAEPCLGTAMAISHFVVGIAGIVLLLSIHFCGVFASFDDLPRSMQWKSRAHTRVDWVESISKIMLITLFHVMLSRGQHQAFNGIMSFTSAFVAAAYCIWIPYYKAQVTCFKVGTFVTLSGIATLAAALRSAPPVVSSSNTEWDAVLLCSVAFVCPLLGAVLAPIRLSKASSAQTRRATIGGGSTQGGILFPSHLPADERSPYRDLEGVIVGEMLFGKQQLTADRQREVDLWAKTTPQPSLFAVLFETDIEASCRFLVQYDDIGVLDPPAQWVAFALRIFTKGMVKYSGSRVVEFAFATFLASFSAPRLQLALRICETLNSTANLLWGVRIQRRILQISSAMNLKDNSHKKLLAYTLRVHRDALAHMTQFWSKLRAEQVDMARLSELAKSITELREQGTVLFDRLLSETIDASTTVRYAKFLEQVMMDSEAADTARDFAIETLQMESGAMSMTHSTSKTEAKNITKLQRDRTDTASSSETIVGLQWTMNIGFLVISLLALGLLIYVVVLADRRSSIVDQFTAAGSLRSIAQQSLVEIHTLHRLMQQSATDEGVDVPSAVSDSFMRLEGFIVRFRSLFASITTGSLAIEPSTLGTVWTELRDDTKHSTLAIWTLGDSFISLLESISTAPRDVPLSATRGPELFILLENQFTSFSRSQSNSNISRTLWAGNRTHS